MRTLRSLLAASAIAGGLAVLPGAASAAPGILGPSGYFFTPDATILPKGCIAPAWHHFHGEVARGMPEQLQRRFPPDWDMNAYSINAGLSCRTEIGATFIDNLPQLRINKINGKRTFDKHDETIFNLKFNVFANPEDRPVNVTLGVMDAANSVHVTPYLYTSGNVGPYIQRTPVVGYLLPRALTAGIGVATGIMQGIFVNTGLPVLPNVELMYEFINKNRLPGYEEQQNNIGMRFRTKKAPGLALDVGATNLDKPTFGFSYTFCPGQKHQKDYDEEEDYEKGKGEEKGKGGGSLYPEPPAPRSLPGAPPAAPQPGVPGQPGGLNPR
jgi:hypothetical protein